ncbi:MAG: ABC transporter permease subunit [Rhodospirillaceae bacterium]|nr:MAG: ABC transporter permease subunit [Rhodospirillaceae bacterium]
MMAAFGDALVLLVQGDPALWDVILRSLWVSSLAAGLAMMAAIPLGVVLGTRAFRGRWLINTVISSFQAVPAVVVGLLVYLLLSRQGLLGELRLLFTSWAILIAQFILVLPLALALVTTRLSDLWRRFGDLYQLDGAGYGTRLKALVRMAPGPLIVVGLTVFGRAISEVGAAIIVGGNLEFATRVLTTAIKLEVEQGKLAQALAFGMVLLVLAFAVNLAARLVAVAVPAEDLERK